MFEHRTNQAEMIDEIKAKRELMIKCANTLGFTSEETIKYSQELDTLINNYHRYMENALKSDEEVKFAFNQMVMIIPKLLV